MKKILVLGDTHGNSFEMFMALDFASEHEANAILQVGDFGYWPRAGGEKFLKRTSKRAKYLGIPIYWVDGNHEDFGHLHENYGQYSDKPVRIRDHVYWLPRGLRFEWEGVSILAMGGAASIDRWHRTLGHSWFLEEMISDEDVLRAQPAQIVVSHDSPVNPLELTGRRFIVDEDSEFCRQQMRRVVNIAQPELVLTGHYHMRSDVEILRDGGYSRVVTLNCDGTYPENAAILVLDSGAWKLYDVEHEGM